MSFPYIANQNFETGTTGQWDAETDTQSKLNVRHWRDLALHGARLELPFQGAYAAHVDLSLGTADAFLQENDLYDLAADGTLFLRLYFYAKGLVMAANDLFTVFTLQSSGPTDEAIIYLRAISATNIVIGAAENAAAAGGASSRECSLIQGEWHALELGVNIDAGVGNDGTLDFYVDGYQLGTQVTGLDQGAIVQARLGAIGIDAGTTAGHLLFDSVVADDTRVYPVRSRFSEQQMAFASAHLFLGQGQLQQVTLLAGAATDNSLILYDTDEANTNDPSNIIVPELRNAQGASDTVTYYVPEGQGYFERGCYAVLTGTNPRALVMARKAMQGLPALRSFAAHRRVYLAG